MTLPYLRDVSLWHIGGGVCGATTLGPRGLRGPALRARRLQWERRSIVTVILYLFTHLLNRYSIESIQHCHCTKLAPNDYDIVIVGFWDFRLQVLFAQVCPAVDLTPLISVSRVGLATCSEDNNINLASFKHELDHKLAQLNCRIVKWTLSAMFCTQIAYDSIPAIGG